MKTNHLKIGIPARFFHPSKGRDPLYGTKTYAAVETDALDYVSEAGAFPTLLPPMSDGMLRAMLEEMDGLLLQGGVDMAPAAYGEEPIDPEQWPGDAIRDALELKALGMAMELEMPVFGICRGFQVMNVFFGGSLYQDLPSQWGTSLSHRELELYDRHWHGIELEAGGLLEGIYADELGKGVNSVHHQGVKRLGEGLRVEARSPGDGLVEAFTWENAAAGKVMGVQWHPEFSKHGPAGLLSADRLMEHWLGHCKEYRAGRS